MITSKYQNRARIIVLGDHETGKSFFLEKLCAKRLPLEPPPSTHVCDCFVFQHSNCWFEFLEISSLSVHKHARSVFYENVDGILFIFDISNPLSQSNLGSWMSEISAYVSVNTPAFIVGTKYDQLDNHTRISLHEYNLPYELASWHQIEFPILREFLDQVQQTKYPSTNQKSLSKQPRRALEIRNLHHS